MKNNSSFKCGHASDKGPKVANEDRFFFQSGVSNKEKTIAIALVADGMGGYQAGDRASELVVSTIQNWWNQRRDQLMLHNSPLGEISQEVDLVINQMNDALLEIKRIEKINLGTTISLLVLCNGEYIVKHVGDSRIYRLYQKGREFSNVINNVDDETTPLDEQSYPIINSVDFPIEQLTEDHSWVELQIKQGLLTKEEARVHPKRNIILQCLGIEKSLQIFTSFGQYEAGDLFLICSDGFYGLYSDEHIATTIGNYISAQIDLQTTSEQLVKTAASSPHVSDNISVVLIREEVTSSRPAKGWKKIFSMFNS